MIPAAEEIIRAQFCHGESDELMAYMNDTIEPEIKTAMVKFARMHVDAALKCAAEKATTRGITNTIYKGLIQTPDKVSILNSYNLDNIK